MCCLERLSNGLESHFFPIRECAAQSIDRFRSVPVSVVSEKMTGIRELVFQFRSRLILCFNDVKIVDVTFTLMFFLW